jgi:hypothetical protein
MKSALAIAAFVLLAACDTGADKAKEADGETNASAEAAGKEQFSLKVPGFEMKVDMPEEGVRTDEDSDLIYPGSRMTGINIDAAQAGSGKESVELRFLSSAPASDVAAWYRDSARGAEFTVSRFVQEGDAYQLAGEEKGGDSNFELTLAPAKEGGTTGRMVLRDRK